LFPTNPNEESPAKHVYTAMNRKNVPASAAANLCCMLVVILDRKGARIAAEFTINITAKQK
jgi:hypothetical protein